MAALPEGERPAVPKKWGSTIETLELQGGLVSSYLEGNLKVGS